MTTLPGVLAGLGAAAGWALASHLYARALERHSSELTPPAVNLFKNGLALLVLGVVAAAIGAGYPGDERVGWLLVSGLLGFALGDALYFAAFPRCGVQVAAILGNLVPPIAALLAFLVLDEALPPLGLIGMGVSLAGIVLVVIDRRGLAADMDRRARWVGIGYAFLNAIFQAVGILLGRMGFEGTDLLPGTVLRLTGGVGGALLAVLLCSLHGGPRLMGTQLALITAPLRRPRMWRVLFFATFVGAIVNLPLHSLAMGRLTPGVSSILFATTPLWTLPIGLRLGARYGWRTAVGTIAAFAGVGLVIAATA